MICVECESPRIENRELMLCASCNKARRKTAQVKVADGNTSINKHSEKGGKVNSRYLTKIRTWKRGKKCTATFEHECSEVIECHHMAGRSNDSFHDEWAEEQNIVLTLDDRFWMPLCPEAHRYVTKHSKWASENGYSFLRIADPVFRK